MTNHEERRDFTPFVHMVMAFNKSENKANPPVIRRVVHKSLEETLRTFRPMLQALGGEWRIHHTVNARDTERARRHLLTKLINHPEMACSIDIEFRTSLLQRSCVYGEKHFMFDVDTKDHDKLVEFEKLVLAGRAKVGETFPYIMDGKVKRHESPKGYHYITKPFDTREVCKLDYVTLLRDGYYYLETVGK